MSNINAAKSAMGYQPANHRPACNNCMHAEERVCIYPTWWCGKGAFLVSALSVCAHHARHRDAATPSAEQVAA